MNKSDLKDGMVVTIRGGQQCILSGDFLFRNNFTISSTILDYNEDLTSKKNKHSDIVKVFSVGKEKELWKREEVDWSKVPVDTKVLVSDGGKHWYKRYFVKYGNGMYYTFPDGLTSWSANEENGVIKWKYCKLAEKPKEEEVTFYDIEKEMNQYCHDQNEDRICQQECDTCGMKYILDYYNVTRKDNK